MKVNHLLSCCTLQSVGDVFFFSPFKAMDNYHRWSCIFDKIKHFKCIHSTVCLPKFHLYQHVRVCRRGEGIKLEKKIQEAGALVWCETVHMIV